MTKIYLMLIFVVLSGCGGGSDGGSSSSGAGLIKATITGSRSFDPKATHGKIVEYKVTISADDIAEPLVAKFDGSADSGVIQNVPAGSGRFLKVEAINPNGAKIREGEAAELEVSSDAVTEASVEMSSVPIFANITSGSSVPNTRFIAKIFGDPSGAVVIEDEFGGASLPVFDVSTGLSEILTDASTGMAVVRPPLLPVGDHRFTVKDVRTGRLSFVDVRITDGERLEGAPIFSAGSTMPARFGNAQGVTFGNY